MSTVPPRAVADALGRMVLSAALVVPPADLEGWARALGAQEYAAWRLPSGEISVVVTADVGGRHVRVSAVFPTPPSFMSRTAVRALPSFDGPAPAARLRFSGAGQPEDTSGVRRTGGEPLTLTD